MAEQPKPQPKLEDLPSKEQELTPEETERVQGGLSFLKATKPKSPGVLGDPCEGGE